MQTCNSNICVMHSMHLATMSLSFRCDLKRTNIHLLGSSRQATLENVWLIVKCCTFTVFWKSSGLYISLKDQLHLCFSYMWGIKLCRELARKKESDRREHTLSSEVKTHLEKSTCTSATSSDSIWRSLSEQLTVILPCLKAWSSQEKSCGCCLL